MKTRVFLSYSRKDHDLHKSILDVLDTNKDLEVVYDKVIPRGNTLHRDIYKKVSTSHIIIPLITKHSFNSQELYNELLIAFHENLIISPIVIGISNDKLKNKFSFIIEDWLCKEIYPSFFVKIFKKNKIKENIKSLTKEILSEVLNEIEHTGEESGLESANNILHMYRKQKVDSNISLSKKRLMRCVISETEKELKKIITNNYSVSIGMHNSFLLRAQYVFSKAEKIYAVSVDKVSEFWAENEYHDDVLSYIQKQPKNTTRLFIYSDPTTLHLHQRILDAHSIQYGKNGGVLVSSLSQYGRMLEEDIIPSESRKIPITNSDFAILKFTNSLGKKVWYKAELNKYKLVFRQIDSREISLYKKFISCLENTKVLKRGSWYEDKIYNWKLSKDVSEPEWKNTLMKMFSTEGKLHGKTFHLVRFMNNSKYVKEAIRLAKCELQKKKSEGRIFFKNIFSVRKIRLNVNDGRYEGPLKTTVQSGNNLEWDQALLLDFHNQHELKDYYSEHNHSKIREQVLSTLDESFKKQYEIVRREFHFDENSYHDRVEEKATEYISRLDMKEEYDIDSILESTPILFKGNSKNNEV